MSDKKKNLKIDSLKSKGCIPGLEPEFAICRILGNPQNDIKIIHIAGTNGKGSTGYFIQHLLTLCGMKVGRYSSPAVYSKYEVIDINGISITEQEYINYTNRVILESEKNNISITEFEAEVAATFLFFKEKNVDFAVIECGMGGLLDATNIISSPEISVITSISIDHTAFLGNNLSDIAKHKCGIIKKNCPVVIGIGAYESLEIIKNTAESLNSEIHTTEKESIIIHKQNSEGQLFSYKKYKNIFTNQLGLYQPENIALALETFDIIKNKYNLVCDANIYSAFSIKNTDEKLFGRFTILNQSPLIIVDGAHNVGAASKLRENIIHYFKNKKISLIFGTFRDKEYKKCTDMIFPYSENIFIVNAHGNRSVNCNELTKELSNGHSNIISCSEYSSAILSALVNCPDVIIAFGSLSYLKFIKSACDEIFFGNLKRISLVVKNEKFLSLIKKIEQDEKNRIFCKHDFKHLVKTAEICYTLSCKYNLNIKKDIIYAVSFMHDLGRAVEYETGISHEEYSSNFAEEILSKCNFENDEIKQICDVINSHRAKPSDLHSFSNIFYMADKFSRNCPECSAYDECYWSEEDKSHTTKYI